MLIVLGLYFLILWLVFFKLKLLPWNKTWKIGCISFGMVITVFVIGALKYFTPTSISGVVQSYSQRVYPQVSGEVIWSKSESELVSKGDTLFSINNAYSLCSTSLHNFISSFFTVVYFCKIYNNLLKFTNFIANFRCIEKYEYNLFLVNYFFLLFL